MRKICLIFSMGILLSGATIASAQSFTSMYTDLTGPKCVTLEQSNDEGGSYRGRCPGVAGYKLEIAEGDIRQNLTVITPAGKKYSLDLWTVVGSGFSSLGTKAEWRMHREGGKLVPVALIVRYNVSNAEDSSKSTSWLVVAKITSSSICVTNKLLPGPGANEQARAAADGASGSPCLKP